MLALLLGDNVRQKVLTIDNATSLTVSVKRYYYRHCGSLHEVSRDMVFGEDGLPKDYYPLVGCPICRKICWLTSVYEMGDDD